MFHVKRKRMGISVGLSMIYAEVMARPVIKKESVMIRLSIAEKRLLQKAATAAKRTTSDYVRVAAVEKAEAELRAQSSSGN